MTRLLRGRFLPAAAIAAVLIVLLVVVALRVPHWPPPPDPADYAATIDRAVAAFSVDERDKTTFRPTYDPAGDFLGFSALEWDERGIRTLDEQGIPMIKYGRRYEYNPITVAQYALSRHGQGDTVKFLTAAKFLRNELMGHDGGFRFAYRYRHYLDILEPGWTSAMAQGQALSVFSRAYRIDGDKRWISAGSLALTYLLAGDNGLYPSLDALHRSLDEHHFFAEWPIDPPDFTLNGGIFTMLGLYDWTTLGLDDASHRTADRAWRESLETLVKLLPYFDMGRITAYDLTYLTHDELEPHIIAKYHGVHGYLLHALVSITGDDRLRTWLDRWDSYL